MHAVGCEQEASVPYHVRLYRWLTAYINIASPRVSDTREGKSEGGRSQDGSESLRTKT